MLKYAALLFNTIALLIYQFFFADGITVTQNIPSSVKPDSEFTVQITINKGSVGGFAKLQQDLPEGFTAVQDDNNGASFTFSPETRSVKFIWMSLPSDKEFKIKYKVKVAAGINGDKTMAGKFSYVSDNVKQAIEIAPSIITVGEKSSQPIATNTTATEPTTTATATITPTEPVKTVEPTTTTTEPVVTNTTTTEPPVKTVEPTTTTTEPVVTNTTTTEPPVKTVEPTTTPTTTTTPNNTEQTSVVCARTVGSVTDNFTVEIVVNKGNVTGFAKLLETLPAGFTATAGDLNGASFSFDGQTQKVKFVWVSMPTQTEFRISYKVAVPAGVSGIQNIDGVFSYIENDETKKFILPTSSISMGGGAVANTTTNTTNTANNTTTNTANNTTTNTANNTTTNTANNTTTNTANNTTTNTTNTTATNTTNTTNNSLNNTIPSPQGNVNYKVQIMALYKAVDASSLAARYNINTTVNTEMAAGFTKYTVGSHNDYKEARDARETIKNKGVVGPFVTAYNSGKRITVQEALMITSQKWYR